MITEVEQLAIRPDTGSAARRRRRASGRCGTSAAGAPGRRCGSGSAARAGGAAPLRRIRDRRPRGEDGLAESDLRRGDSRGEAAVARGADRDRELLLHRPCSATTARATTRSPTTATRFENGMRRPQRDRHGSVNLQEAVRGTRSRASSSRIRDRRFVAVDRERGIVFAFALLRPRQHQLDLAARRAVQDRERPDPPDRGGLPSRAVRHQLRLEHLRARTIGGAADHPLRSRARSGSLPAGAFSAWIERR